MKILIFTFLFFGLFSCQPSNNPVLQETEKVSKADSIIHKSIEVYGMQSLNKANLEFKFREFYYTANLNNGEFKYTRLNANSDLVYDVLTNKGFERFVNGDKFEVDSAKAIAYSNSINSVWYFALLPLRLKDEAARKTYLGTIDLNNKAYHVIKVTFSEEGGGQDFDDEYMYWFEEKTLKMPMFAYNYSTNGGGVRFRTIKSDTLVNGVLFQDYYNLKPHSIETPLDSLPFLWVENELDTVSVIENKSVKVTLFD